MVWLKWLYSADNCWCPCQWIGRSMSFSCKNYFLKFFRRNSISNKGVPLSSWDISEKIQQGRGALKRAWFDSQPFSNRENMLATFYSFFLRILNSCTKFMPVIKVQTVWALPKGIVGATFLSQQIWTSEQNIFTLDVADVKIGLTDLKADMDGWKVFSQVLRKTSHLGENQ